MPRKFVGELFNVSENLGSRKVFCIIGWYHDFPSKIFSLTVPKNFVWEPFYVSENLRYGKKLRMREGYDVCVAIIFWSAPTFLGTYLKSTYKGPSRSSRKTPQWRILEHKVPFIRFTEKFFRFVQKLSPIGVRKLQHYFLAEILREFCLLLSEVRSSCL